MTALLAALLGWIRKNPVLALALAAILALLALSEIQTLRLHRAQRQYAAAALRADSTAAAADTTHRLAVKAIGDLEAGFVKRVVQAEQRGDSLDHALKTQRIALAAIKATLRPLADTLTAQTVVDSLDVRHAHFESYRAPYAVVADVAIPKPPQSAALRLGITMDTLSLGLRLTCGKAGPDGIRPAEAVAVVPEWAVVRFDAVTQAPDLCRSPALSPPRPKRWPWLVAGAVLGATGFALLHH